MSGRRSVRFFRRNRCLSNRHMSGLAPLTHTPSPMGVPTNILARAQNERPLVLIPVGFPSADRTVPAIPKKSLGEVVEVR